MRALRVVGLTEDGEVVLEDPVRLERFRVAADERLRAAARGDLSRLGQIAIELESQLRPREIQARIRAGASVEQVAAAAGVPEQKIERFAYPVLLERFRTAEVAQRAHPVRAEGPDNRTLADVVAHTFGLRGQAYEGARWDSWKGEDGRWVVALDWRAGRSHNRAHWTFQPGAHGGTVTALDEHASDLVEGLPARPLRTVGAVVDMARPEEEPSRQSPVESPVEQWRAAASDSYRERMPHAPEPRPTPERGSSRPEPWRPAPPAQRQGEREPVETPVAERAGAYRGAEARPEREGANRSADRAPAERSTVMERNGVAVPPAREPARPEPSPAVAGASDPAATPPAATTVDTPALDVEAEPAQPQAAETPEDAPEPARATAPDAGPNATPDPPAPTEADASTEVTAPTEASNPTEPTAETTPPPVDGAPAPEAPAEVTAEPAAQAETAAVDAPAGRRTRKGKPVMPSWDEVLLGVRGPR